MTQLDFNITFSRSISALPSLRNVFIKLCTFLLNNWLAWLGTSAASSEFPIIVTPCFTTVFPSSVSSQLPPVEEAISTITEPTFIFSTISFVTSIGAGLPLSCAVVMITSAFTASSKILSLCFCLYSSVCSTAYPPAALSSLAPSTSTNLAPRLATSSLAAARVSKPPLL